MAKINPSDPQSANQYEDRATEVDAARGEPSKERLN
jgi:hypothetical protein